MVQIQPPLPVFKGLKAISDPFLLGFFVFSGNSALFVARCNSVQFHDACARVVHGSVHGKRSISPVARPVLSLTSYRLRHLNQPNQPRVTPTNRVPARNLPSLAAAIGKCTTPAIGKCTTHKAVLTVDCWGLGGKLGRPAVPGQDGRVTPSCAPPPPPWTGARSRRRRDAPKGQGRRAEARWMR